MCLLLVLLVQTARCPGAQDRIAETSDETVAAQPSGSSVSLATLLARARSQAKTPGTSDAIGRVENPSHAGVNLGGSLSQDLWSSRTAAPQTGEDTETSLALRRLIRQVRSVKFEGKNAGPTFTPPTEPRPTAGASAEQPADVETQNLASPLPVGPVPTAAAPSPSTALSAKAQKTLDTLKQNPNQIRDPLEMAELLFLSGQASEAVPFYAKALECITRGEPSYDVDRAWILFQLGNCLRETDTAKAQEVYMKLVSEYPASPWTELAKAHGRLLTWYQKSRPGQLAAPPQL